MKAVDALLSLPVVVKGGGDGFSVAWREPEFFKQHVAKIPQCPRLLTMLNERVDAYVQSSAFVLESIRIGLKKDGVVISVEPGVNGCYIAAMYGGLGEHNIDSYAQAAALQHVFTIYLHLAYSVMEIWERDPNAAIDPELAKETELRFAKNLENRDKHLYRVEDNQCNLVGFVIARDTGEAQSLIGGQASPFRLMSLIATKPQFIKTAK
jgi:hypothetical protein